MLAGGKGDGRAIVACGRISSICAVVRSSTICMSWLVLSRTLLSFKVRLDYSTSSLVVLPAEDGPASPNEPAGDTLVSRLLHSRATPRYTRSAHGLACLRRRGSPLGRPGHRR